MVRSLFIAICTSPFDSCKTLFSFGRSCQSSKFERYEIFSLMFIQITGFSSPQTGGGSGFSSIAMDDGFGFSSGATGGGRTGLGGEAGLISIGRLYLTRLWLWSISHFEHISILHLGQKYLSPAIGDTLQKSHTVFG